MRENEIEKSESRKKRQNVKRISKKIKTNSHTHAHILHTLNQFISTSV